MNSIIQEALTYPRSLNKVVGFMARFTALLCKLMIEAFLAISAELITEALGMNEQTNTNKFTASNDETRTNIKGIGSNAGRLYTHTDTKLLKNGGGSSW